ncbi:hypothetical protein Leryth_022665 [Lithospermum erythrorhizon]|nr:hypothetical protein Leryth_022665 [Lithospermum erythrorhizon]
MNQAFPYIMYQKIPLDGEIDGPVNMVDEENGFVVDQNVDEENGLVVNQRGDEKNGFVVNQSGDGENGFVVNPKGDEKKGGVSVKVDEKGVVYEVPDAPFVYQYSYTETPRVRPLGIREPLVSPFGPESMNRPWTGRSLPPVRSLTVCPSTRRGRLDSNESEDEGGDLGSQGRQIEVEDLIKTVKSSRMDYQRHITERKEWHMENVHQQLEEKTGGKIISSKGGVLYLFRGRNYNFKTRPHFPLMLWRPVPPVYPRLIKHVPEGLTLEEATEMRKRGRNLIPICKLAKNGVYNDLAKNVREAFEACELVRINCQGLNGSDFRKIGAKLKDLVPCVLISFEEEHILMWRGHDWKSSLDLNDEPNAAGKSEADKVASGSPRDGETVDIVECEELNIKRSENFMTNSSIMPSEASTECSLIPEDYNSEGPLQIVRTMDDHLIALKEGDKPRDMSDGAGTNDYNSMVLSAKSEIEICNSPSVEVQSDISSTLAQNVVKKLETSVRSSDITKPTSILCTERVLKLQEQAVETGSAIILAESDLNADTVFQRSISFAKSAPPGPVFKYKPRRVKLNSSDEHKISSSEEEDITVSENDTTGSSEIKIGASGTKTAGRTPRNRNMEDFKEGYLNIAARGSLKVDELAKLLA